MQYQQRMLEIQKQMAEEQRKWQHDEAMLDREWREKQEAKRFGKSFWIIGIGATIMIIASTIIAAYIERSGQPTIINYGVERTEVNPPIPDKEGSQP